MLYGAGSFKSLTKVKYVPPPPEYPFLCVFKEASDAEADPEAIMGVFVDFGSDEQRHIVCVSPDGETLVFDVIHECPDIEKERAKIKPKKSETDDKGFITEEFDRAWSCSCNMEPPQYLLDKIKEVLGKML